MRAPLPRRVLFLAATLLAAVLLLGTAPALAQVVYTSTFGSGAGPQWSNTKTERTLNNVPFLGRFGNESVRLSLAPLPAHTYASVTFDVYVIQGWDGNGTANGPAR